VNIELSSDASDFIDSLVSSGDFRNRDEAVAEGIRLLMSREKLRAEVQAGIDDANAGNLVDADEVYAEARRRIQAVEEQ
jgi:antitoxin ParD1/3/4